MIFKKILKLSYEIHILILKCIQILLFRPLKFLIENFIALVWRDFWYNCEEFKMVYEFGVIRKKLEQVLKIEALVLRGGEGHD